MHTEIESRIVELTNLHLNKYTKNVGQFFFLILFLLLIVFGAIVGLVGSIISFIILSAIGLSSLAGYSGVLILFGIVYTPLKVIKTLEKYDPLSLLPKNTLKLYKISRDIPFSAQKIETILDLVQISEKQLISLSRFERFSFFLSRESKNNITKLKTLIYPIIFSILKDLQGDMLRNLRIQEKRLQKAKIQTEKYVTGSREINHVSEFQKNRLDRQIEQFKELQRVLVKL